jgi:hypothetical protein
MESTSHNKALSSFVIPLSFGAGALAGIANVAYTMPLYFLGWIVLVTTAHVLGRGKTMTQLRHQPKVKLVALTTFLSGFALVGLFQTNNLFYVAISTAALVLSAAVLVGVLLPTHQEKTGLS